MAPPSALSMAVLIGLGIAWGILSGALSRPRWEGKPRWWPIAGRLGFASYGAAVGTTLVVMVQLVWVLTGNWSQSTVFVLAACIVFAFACLSRIGRAGGPEPAIPQLKAGAIVIIIALLAALAIQWYVKFSMTSYFY